MSEGSTTLQAQSLDQTPAWKRLGLALKSAEAVPNHPDSAIARKKRPATEELGSFDQSPKKLRPSHATSLEPKDVITSAPSSSNTSNEKKRSRGVQFSSDTKTEDARSIKDLHNDWLARQKSSNPSFDAQSTPAALQVNQSTKELAQKKPKRDKKKQKAARQSETKEQMNGDISDETHPALAYLSQHLTDRSHWKFNKAKQNYILKHCLDTTAIPNSYHLALFTYITSMMSQAAIARLRNAVLQMREEDRKKPKEEAQPITPASQGMSQAHQDAYDAALEEWVAATVEQESKNYNRDQAFYAEILAAQDPPKARQLSESERKRLDKRKRAEAILKLLNKGSEAEVRDGDGNGLVTASKDESANSISEPPLITKPGKTTRKRKRRTAEVDSDSDTSSSDSSSD